MSYSRPFRQRSGRNLQRHQTSIGRNLGLNTNRLAHLRLQQQSGLPVHLKGKAVYQKLIFLNLLYKAFIDNLGLAAEFDQSRQLLLPVLLNLRLPQLAGVRVEGQPQPG